MWGDGPEKCLVVPNFSLGAVLMMWLAEKASPYFTAAEFVELHHDRKADAPSGTALATAERMKPADNAGVGVERVDPRGTRAPKSVGSGCTRSGFLVCLRTKRCCSVTPVRF